MIRPASRSVAAVVWLVAVLVSGAAEVKVWILGRAEGETEVLLQTVRDHVEAGGVQLRLGQPAISWSRARVLALDPAWLPQTVPDDVVPTLREDADLYTEARSEYEGLVAARREEPDPWAREQLGGEAARVLRTARERIQFKPLVQDLDRRVAAHGRRMEADRPPDLPAPHSPDPVWAWTATGRDGLSRSAADYRGRSLLILVTAADCPPCEAARQEIEARSRDLRRRGLVVLGVDGGPKPAPPSPFPVEQFHQPGFARDLRVSLLPAAVLLDASGRVEAVAQGPFGEAYVWLIRHAERIVR